MMRPTICMLLTLCALAIAGAPASASGGRPSSDSEEARYQADVVEIAPDIYVMTRAPSWRSPVQGNVLVIVNDEDVVVADGGFPSHVENVVAAIARITDKPVSTVLMTHWHGDHNLGHAVYRRHYPDVRIVAQENTRSFMERGATDYILRTQQADVAATAEYYRGLVDAARVSDAPPAVVAFYEDAAAGAERELAEYRRGGVNYPDETFTERLVLHRGERRIEFLYLGRANTAGDALVWLPAERILAAGDIVVRPTPYGFGSYPREWAATLRRINEIDFDILVPGHGDLQRDGAYVATLAEMMDSISDQAERAAARGADSVEALGEQIDFSDFEARIAGEDPLLRHLFDIWFKTPISQSLFRQATGAPISQFED